MPRTTQRTADGFVPRYRPATDHPSRWKIGEDAAEHPAGGLHAALGLHRRVRPAPAAQGSHEAPAALRLLHAGGTDGNPAAPESGAVLESGRASVAPYRPALSWDAPA